MGCINLEHDADTFIDVVNSNTINKIKGFKIITGIKYDKNDSLISRLSNSLSDHLDFEASFNIKEDNIFNNLKVYIDYPKEKGTERYIEAWTKLIEIANSQLEKEDDFSYDKVVVILK